MILLLQDIIQVAKECYPEEIGTTKITELTGIGRTSLNRNLRQFYKKYERHPERYPIEIRKAQCMRADGESSGGLPMPGKCEEIRITLSMEEAVNFLDHDDLREMIWEKMPAPAQCEWLKKMMRRRDLEIGQKLKDQPLHKWESMADQEYRLVKLILKLGPSSIIELKNNPECPTFAAIDKAFMDHLISSDENRKYYVTKRGEQYLTVRESSRS